MILFQTVEDRNNPDDIEANAPFICNANNAWLGKGYYFWDTLIENAHWWGGACYAEYIIVQYNCNSFTDDNCYDLHGNMEHLKQFNELIDLLKEQKLFTHFNTVARVIEYLKNTTDFANTYDAIRAYGHFSKSNKYKSLIRFELGGKHYLERTPAVQLCLFRKSSLRLSGGKIVYPNHYNEDYLA